METVLFKRRLSGMHMDIYTLTGIVFKLEQPMALC